MPGGRENVREKQLANAGKNGRRSSHEHSLVRLILQMFQSLTNGRNRGVDVSTL